jgi:hypothetical protein
VSPRTLAVCLALGLFGFGYAISVAYADIACNEEVCAMKRADMELIVREILRLRTLTGKDCT